MNFNTFKSNLYNVEIDYPETWTVEKDILTFLSPLESQVDKFKENINIVLRVLPYELSYDEYIKLHLSELEKVSTNYKLSEEKDVTLSGNKAKQYIFTSKQGIYSLKFLQVIALVYNTAYIITFTAEENQFNKYKDIAKKMVESFKITSKYEPSKDERSADFVTFRNEEFDVSIKIDHPGNWDVIKDSMIFLTPLEGPLDSFREYVDIDVHSFPMEIELDDFTQANLEELKRLMTDFKLLEGPTETELDGYRAHKIIFTMKQGKYKLKFLSVYMIRGTRAYVITYTAEESKYDQFLPTVEKMLATFDLI